MELEIWCVASGHWAGISQLFLQQTKRQTKPQPGANSNTSFNFMTLTLVQKSKEMVRHEKSMGPPGPDFWAQGAQCDQRTNRPMNGHGDSQSWMDHLISEDCNVLIYLRNTKLI